ncbi:hypothetical protein ACF1B0_02205 [Streptomyces anandii]|uniref:hypothetical protein n=1 Tax=Streptomyces anandii TaxID=285454 RepID=UPI0036F70028
MAEHDSDRERREGQEGRESREPAESLGSLGSGADAGQDPDAQSTAPEGSGAAPPEPPERPSTGSAPQEGVPLDEEAAWAAIVAGYGEEPPDPPGTRPYRPVEDLKLPDFPLGPDTVPNTAPDTAPDTAPNTAAGGDAASTAPEADDAPPRAERPAERPKEDRPAPARPLGGSVSFAPGVGPRDYTPREPSDEDDEGHFVPPEPPPLPDADVTSKFAWLAVTGGPVLLLLAVLFGWDMTWWLTTLGIGGFLGGFATLVTRMKPDDEDDDDPGRGAVV